MRMDEYCATTRPIRRPNLHLLRMAFDRPWRADEKQLGAALPNACRFDRELESADTPSTHYVAPPTPALPVTSLPAIARI